MTENTATISITLPPGGRLILTDEAGEYGVVVLLVGETMHINGELMTDADLRLRLAQAPEGLIYLDGDDDEGCDEEE